LPRSNDSSPGFLASSPRRLRVRRAPIAVSWRYRPKQQPERTRFRVPPVDAPNVNGARLFGLVAGNLGDEVGPPDIATLRSDIDAGRVSALYVFDPGPEGSLGETKWILDARRAGDLEARVGLNPLEELPLPDQRPPAGHLHGGSLDAGERRGE